jgi:choline dehydrogenase-like flavoprotein
VKIPEYDVVIIGAGAGGGASAWALTMAGMRVLLLEAGPAYNPYKDYQLASAEWERQVFPEKKPQPPFYSFAPMQTLEKKHQHLRSWSHITGHHNNSDKRIGWKYHHVRGLGGSTLHFTGEAHRLSPQAMRIFSSSGVSADWPLKYQQLEPYYTIAEQVVGVAGPGYDPLHPRSKPYPLPAHHNSYASEKLSKGFAKLGMSCQANSLAILSRAYDNRPGCNYCANCNRGCPRKDKGSVDVTFLHQALQTGLCDIRTEADVLSIKPGPERRVKAVLFQNNLGETQRVDTRILLVCTGAIATPRLLLLSSNQYAPNGLANESGRVGQNFMETLAWTSSGLYPEPLGSQRGIPAELICWDYNLPEAIPGVIGGCRFSSGTAQADLLGPISYARRVVKGWGIKHKQQMRHTYGRVLSVNAIGEALSNSESYVSLDKDKADKLGRPLARIHTFLDEMAIARLDFMAKKSRDILLASGVDDIFEEYGNYDFFSSTHVFGTCRMGISQENSVVNADCRAHQWKNLYIVDASVFPSSGGGEAPSLTIEALAIRTAQHIRNQVIRKML